MQQQRQAVRRIEKSSTFGSTRFYQIRAGVCLPSVTSILDMVAKPGLHRWIASSEREAAIRTAQQLIHEREMRGGVVAAGYSAELRERLGEGPAYRQTMNDAGNVGTAAHLLIEWSLRRQLGEEPPQEAQASVDPRVLSAFTAYDTWRKEVDLKPLATEQMVWSEEHGYAGTLDALGELTLDGERVLAVFDWKTGGVHPEALLQIVAYMRAAVERGLVSAPLDGVVVNLPKNPKETKVKVRRVRWDEHEPSFQAFLAAKALWVWKNGDKAAA